MNYKILTLNDRIQWKELFFKLPENQQDIYYTPEYYSLYENYGDGKAQCFVFEKNGELALYPFLINSVNELGYDLAYEYYDIQGAYGYNGVLTSSNDEKFVEAFYKAFKEFCNQNNIIAEFVRFNPIIKNHNFSKSKMHIIQLMENVIVDLSIKDLYNNAYEHSTRKNINKALKNELNVEFYFGNNVNDTKINIFKNLYINTMERNQADKYYYFNDKFYNDIFEKLGDNVLLVFIKYLDRYIASEIIPIGDQIGYSFLGGSTQEFFNLRPNDILKHSIILKLQELNKKYFCLGGGNDGIIKFKKTFSKNGNVPFYIGKKIHNKKVYNNLISEWETRNPESFIANNNYFLRYRLIKPNINKSNY